MKERREILEHNMTEIEHRVALSEVHKIKVCLLLGGGLVFVCLFYFLTLVKYFYMNEFQIVFIIMKQIGIAKLLFSYCLLLSLSGLNW